MACKIVENWLASQDGVWPDQMASHLSECDDCVDALIQHQLSGRDPVFVPPGFAQRVIARLPEPRRESRTITTGVTRGIALALIALVLISAALLASVGANVFGSSFATLLLLCGVELVLVLVWIYRPTVI